MTLRKVRRGRRAGSQFWGCSDFPRCRGTRDYDGIGSTAAGPQTEEPTHPQPTFTPNTSDILIPFDIRVKPHSPFSVVEIHDSVGAVFDQAKRRIDTVKTFNWAWERGETAKAELPEVIDAICSVMDKHFHRGRSILLDPALEQFLIANRESLNRVFRTLRCSAFGIDSFEFGSPEEKRFVELVLSKHGGASRICPQVSISSLTGDATDIHRYVDFVAMTPSGPAVIEVDGIQHTSGKQREIDKSRDMVIRAAGADIIRIPVSDIEVAVPGLSLVAKERGITPEQFAHSLWVGMLSALRSGILRLGAGDWKLNVGGIDPEGAGSADVRLCIELVKTVVQQFFEYLRNLIDLYPTDAPLPYSVHIEFAGRRESIVVSERANNRDQPSRGCEATFHYAWNDKHPGPPLAGHYYYRDLPLDRPVWRTLLSSSAIQPRPDEAACRYFLGYFFRHPNFRDGQWSGIQRALRGEDSLVLMPTGHGKSVMFQLAALLRPGVAIVVDPIISLIDDQIDNLSSVGMNRVIGISSQIAERGLRDLVHKGFSRGEYLFCFVAPERFQIPEFRDALRELTTHTCISVIAIDEAHCVSEWGHDFRTSYLNLARNSREFCSSAGYTPPLMGLTGTAPRSVLKDVKRELEIFDFDALITPDTFDRPELKFKVFNCASDQKFPRLKGILNSLPGSFGKDPAKFFGGYGKSDQCGIVFCPHVNGDYGTVSVAEEISSDLGISANHYSGSRPKRMPAGNWDEIKRSTAMGFKRDEYPLLVATKAFGMGIDKPNIRYTIHYSIPPSIESFYQEAGRAGRDRNPAYCYILASNDQPNRATRLLGDTTSLAEIHGELKAIDKDWDAQDDITRSLFFHTNAFKGIDTELSDVGEVLGQIGNLTSENRVSLDSEHIELQRLEKAVHRLVTIGLVRDYTIDYPNKRIGVVLSGASETEMTTALRQYVANYQQSRARLLSGIHRGKDESLKAFVLKLVQQLLIFVYETIELGRRRALLEMVQTCTSDATDAAIRTRILSYLEKSEFDERLDQIVDDVEDWQQVYALLDDVVSPRHATELRGQIGRYLESYPDHPSLLFLRGLVEFMCEDRDLELVRSSFENWGTNSKKRYQVSPATVTQFYSLVERWLERADKNLRLFIADRVLKTYNDETFSRSMFVHARIPAITELALSHLVTQHGQRLTAAEQGLLEALANG